MKTTVPAIVTRRMCVRALNALRPSFRQLMGPDARGLLGMLNPALPFEPKLNGGPLNLKFIDEAPFFLYPFGDYTKWDLPYGLVGLSKAYGPFKTGFNSGEIPPALYEPGMSPFKGAIKGPRTGATIFFTGLDEEGDLQVSRQFDQTLGEYADAALEMLGKPQRRSLVAPEHDLSLQDVADVLGFNLDGLFKPIKDHLKLQQEMADKSPASAN